MDLCKKRAQKLHKNLASWEKEEEKMIKLDEGDFLYAAFMARATNKDIDQYLKISSSYYYRVYLDESESN